MLIKNISDDVKVRNRLLDTYIRILTDDYKHAIPHNQLVDLLKSKFNFSVDLDIISQYFEPTFEDIQKDLIQQMKNIGVQYD